MKAIVYHKYGSPNVLELQEVAKPVPKEHEILIHVHATVVTPADIAFRKGEPFIGRFFSGLIRPKGIPGVEFAGDIEAVGTAVTLFQKGDQVLELPVPALVLMPSTHVWAKKVWWQESRPL